MVQRILSILADTKNIWPLSSRWYDHLERFHKSQNAMTAGTEGSMDDSVSAVTPLRPVVFLSLGLTIACRGNQSPMFFRQRRFAPPSNRSNRASQLPLLTAKTAFQPKRRTPRPLTRNSSPGQQRYTRTLASVFPFPNRSMCPTCHRHRNKSSSLMEASHHRRWLGGSSGRPLTGWGCSSKPLILIRPSRRRRKASRATARHHHRRPGPFTIHTQRRKDTIHRRHWL